MPIKAESWYTELMDAETVIEHLQTLSSEEKRKVREYLDTQALDGGSDVKGKQIPKPGLHLGAMEMSPDFDAPSRMNFG